MRIRLSHRFRIAIATAAVSAALFASMLFATYATMFSMERRASKELLEAPMSEIISSLRSGEPLDEEVGSQERVTVVVFSPDGKERFRSGLAPVGPWTASGDVRLGHRDLMYRTAMVGSNRVVAAVDWTRSLAQLQSLRSIFAVLLLPLSIIVGLAAYIAAGLMYRPLRKLTTAAKALGSAGKIGQLEDPHDREFSPLAHEINTLLHRIAAEVERQERLVTDVAHDLLTPLTIIRGRLETALMLDSTQEYPAAMRIAIREAERLSTMAESILESGIQAEDARPIELSAIFLEAVERWKPAFQQRNALLEAQGQPCTAQVTEEEWNSILDNLFDNAFKYGGNCCIANLIPGEEIVLEIKDNGPGVPKEERERVFERFVRLDPSRSSSGHGLGLYLCASILRKRGGAIRILKEAGMAIAVSLPTSGA